MRSLSIVLALLSVARADVSTGTGQSGDKDKDAAVLRIEFTTKQNPDEKSAFDAATSGLWLRAASGKQLWRIKPPEALAQFTVDKKSAAKYQRDPRAPLEALGWPFLATLTLPDAIVVYGAEHLIVFARHDGRVLFDQPLGEMGFGSLSFKRADVTIQLADGTRCRHRAGSFAFLPCGDQLIVLHGPGIVTYKMSPWAPGDTHMYPDVVGPPVNGNEYPFTVGAVKVTIKVLER